MMKLHLFFLAALTSHFFLASDAWRFWRKNSQCPSRNGASPYFFGTTDLNCMMAQRDKFKRSVPKRNIWSYIHRFVYYRGKYFDFLRNSRVKISSSRLNGHVCSGRMEGKPAGYSQLNLSCIMGCAKNYPCKYGKYFFLWNNCHRFANKLSEVLCSSGAQCPSWCLGNCNTTLVN
ncbi:uncharacterized protein LOC125659854 [Ostrea edulis]|uniref:uncharacterized protein LOC125659854 n=1 Tax=Ostrea edulis TaxID=37623 RepID=UPI0024AF8E44|nr:uncharacterized protein LOC125659854 [Ostrea edulis]